MFIVKVHWQKFPEQSAIWDHVGMKYQHLAWENDFMIIRLEE